MNEAAKRKSFRPLLFGLATVILLAAITQYVAYQRYLIVKEREQEELQLELSEVQGRFRDILNHSVSSANTIAIIYKRYHKLDDFDSIAGQIMEYNNAIDFINFADKYTITHVYPLQGNQMILGHSLLEVPLFRKELEIATQNKKILFAGPYQLSGGRGVGIACRIPVFINDSFRGLSSVVTKLTTILNQLPQLKNNNNKFVYRLTKINPVTGKTEYFLDGYTPRDNSNISAYMPEGNWKLDAAYSSAYLGSNDASIISLLGLLFSLAIGAFVYNRAKLPLKLERVIELKTNELAGSEKYYRALIESSTDVIALFDESGNAIYRTPSFEKVTGYTVAEMQHLSGIDLVHPDDKAEADIAFKKVAETYNGTLRQQYRLRHKNGHYVYIDGIYRNLLHDAKVNAIVYTYTDVTDKVSALHKLNERVKELSTIFKLNEILKDDARDADEVFTKITTILPPGWQYPEDCEARIHFDGMDYTTGEFHESQYSQVAHFELVDKRKGFVEVVYTKAKPPEDEGCFLKEERDLINTVADTITVYFNKASQKRNLAASEAKFRGAFEHAAIGMALTSPEGKWMMVNKALCDMLGYTEAELSLRTFMELTHPEDLDNNLKSTKQLLEGKIDYFRTNKRYIHKNGSVIWGSLNVALIKNENGEPQYFVSQIKDVTERIRISDQLRENEHKLRLFIEYSPASLAMFDTDIKYILTSRRWKSDYKLEDKELEGKSHYEVFPTIPEHWKEIHQRCLAGASEKCEEDSFTTEDGSLAWLYWEIHPWYKASGEIGGIIMFTEVITERVEARLKFQNLVEKSLVGVYIIQDGKFVYINPKIIEESGYSEQELLTSPMETFVHKDDVAVMRKTLEARMKGEIDSVRYEIRALKKDGGILWMEMFGSTTIYNGMPALIGTMVNITDKKTAYLELEKSEANLKSIFNSAENSYMLIDTDFNILTFNDFFKRGYHDVTGYELKTGEYFLNLVVHEYRDAMLKRLKKVISTKARVEYESSYGNKEKAKHFYSILSPVINNDTVIGISYTGIDITERKKLELDRQQIINDLVQRNRDLEQFSNILSHNVRAPISTILGLSNLFSTGQDAKDLAMTVTGIEQSAVRLDNVVKDLNEILRIKHSLAEIKTKVTFRDIVDEVKSTLAGSITESGATIKTNFTEVEDMNTVQAYMTSIFYNLISNGVKYARPGVPTVINITSAKKDNKIVITFSDNGIGIDLTKYKDQVFGLYKRFHPSVEGKGLGLYIVKTQVNALNGHIDLDSQPGEGSVFTLSFDV